MRIALVALGVLLQSCAFQRIWTLSHRPICYVIPASFEYTSYPVAASKTTPIYHLGLDDPRNELDALQVDETAANVLACLQKTGLPSTDAEKNASVCTDQPRMELKTCLTLRVGNWHVGCPPPAGLGEDVFPCAVGPESCMAKGQTPTSACPCECRAIPQNTPEMFGSAIIVTPQLHVFPQVLAEYLTGCLYPNVGKTAPCASDMMIAPRHSP